MILHLLATQERVSRLCSGVNLSGNPGPPRTALPTFRENHNQGKRALGQVCAHVCAVETATEAVVLSPRALVSLVLPLIL